MVLLININLFTKVDNNGVFKSAFVVHYAAVDAIKAHGRPVCSTDFGHFKHDNFEGLKATGLCGSVLLLTNDDIAFFFLSTCDSMHIYRVVPNGKWQVVGGLDCYIRKQE
jgi:hypothetical protein